MRKFIHIDCDCFFAAIEVRDNPALKGKPVAVGGSAERRGVLSTCNYEAREYGLHSAMATKKALQLCPNLILLPHRFEVYREAAENIRRIFYQYTDLVEPLSLDEAYLDVTESNHCNGVATKMAMEIRQRIFDEVGISASAGIAPNKFLAKVASDWQKPNAQTVIKPQQIDGFVKALPVQKIPGVGKATMKKMHELNVATGADLQQFSKTELSQYFGKFGLRLYNLCRGVDHREVVTSRPRKSLSVEYTLEHNCAVFEQLQKPLSEVFAKLELRLQKIKPARVLKSCFVKVKFADFSIRSKTIAINRVDEAVCAELLKALLEQESLAVRLIGVGVVFQTAGESMQQLSLFEHEVL